MKNMCKIWTTAFMLVFLLPSCSDYLNVVPDNVITLDNIYGLREDAINALAKVYSYLPNDLDTHATTWNLGDEYIGRIDESVQNATSNLRGERIMRGLQSVSSPVLNFWSSRGTGYTNGAKPLYEGLNVCNTFLEEIKKTRGMTEPERNDWIAQVKTLKAYYHFLLIRHYGPIVIVRTNTADGEAKGDDVFQYRDKVEECFRYVIDLIDEAIPDMPTTREEVNLGMIDQVIAQAIKARVLLYYASPFYSGNREFYEDFVDPRDNQPFFPVFDTPEQTKAKWEEALTAVNIAIDAAKSEGKSLYKYPEEKQYFTTQVASWRDDRTLAEINPKQMETLYDLRYLVVDPWNRELVWGLSNINYTADGALSSSTNVRLSTLLRDRFGITGWDYGAAAYSWQWMGATYRMTERYYTKNGLPIDEDATFNYNGRHEAYTTPLETDPEYEDIAGILQPGFQTISLYAGREMRFYANLGFTGGFWRAHYDVLPMFMYQNSPGGRESNVSYDFFCTGIGLQKFVHPESRSNAWQRQVPFPYPLIRLADLYLMKAEILNEIKDAPDREVWDAINLVRARAGIPNVQDSWSNPNWAKTLNKHTTKDGMRDIILRERSIELAFEGHRFWDMQRHKRAHREFATGIQGWSYLGENFNSFFVLNTNLQSRRFGITDYLWPIRLDELNTNANLVQNPGW